MDPARLLGLLGLARRAGKLALGFSAVEQLVRRGEKPLVIVARDMGAAQKGKVERLQPVRGLLDDVLDGADMAAAFGREKLTVVAVSDTGFVKGIEKLAGPGPDGGGPAARG
jgi:ribosomal protein L7Ae-like RNA K-turn-binding protein